VHLKALIEIKQQERERIADDIKDYLARGNYIKVYPVGATGVDYNKNNVVWEKTLKHKKGEST
jgi:hypothetical protein